MADTKIKIKNDNSEGKSLRIQAWNGKLPTYDSEQQRGAALANATSHGVDAAGNAEPLPGAPAPADVLPKDFAKLKKEELIVLANARKSAGKNIELDEADTVAILRAKIQDTYPEPEGDDDGKAAKTAANEPAQAANAGAAVNFNFSTGALLQEITLTPGEEKVIAVTAGMFITIKEEM